MDRKARTRQRRLYTATLITGPAFAEYLVAVMNALERHIVSVLSGGQGIAEDTLARITSVTNSLAGMGDDDDNRKGRLHSMPVVSS